jgi:hypothetical protein
VDVTGRVNRIIAREKKRIEQHGKARMKISPSRIQVQHIRRADDRGPARLYDTMELARERELILEMFHYLETACYVDGVVAVWKSPVGPDLHRCVAKELRK